MHAHLDAMAEPGHAILDVGCGPGTYTLPAARLCRRVVAVDPSPAMLARLRSRLRSEPGLGHVEVATGWLPDRLGVDEPYGGVISIGVLGYVGDLERGVRGLVAGLRPGGWALFTVPPRTLEGRVHALVELLMGRRVHLRSAAESRQACQRAGLEVRSIERIGVTRGGIGMLVRAVRPSG